MVLRRASALLLAISILLVGSFSMAIPASADTPDEALKPCKPGEKVALAATAQATRAATVPAASAPTLLVVTTVSPITNLTFNVAGNRVKIQGLVPEGVNSHTFEPKPSDTAVLSQADIVFVNGLALEVPTQKLAQANLKKGAEIVELGPKAISQEDWAFDFSFPKDGGNPNPHLWINPLLALRYANTIRETLAHRDPANSEYYNANYQTLSERTKVLDQAICDTIASIPAKQRKLLTYHDSYAYFAPRYGMTVIGAIQPADFSEPSAQEVARLIEQIKAASVPAIFGSEVFPSKVLEQIGREAGVRYIDTLADDDLPNKDGNRLYHSYLQLIVNNITTMSTALGGDPAALKPVNTANIPGPDTAVISARE